jgi:hypothetical protein
MDDLVLNVRQIGSYPQLTPGPADAILFQQGGLGGPYAWTSPGALVAPAIAALVTTAQINITGVGPITWGQGQNLTANASGFQFNWPGTPGLLFSISPPGNAVLTGMLSVGRDPATPFEVSTKNYVDATVATAKQLLTDNSVWTVNGKSGNVNLTWIDLIGMGGAPINSPVFQGVPTAPAIKDYSQYDFQIATTQFVQDVVNSRLQLLLLCQPFVFTFNGRSGNVVLTEDDLTSLEPGGLAPLDSPAFTGIPTAPTAALDTATDQLATCNYVNNAITEFSDSGLFAPINSPNFTGIPTAPTAAVGSSTGQLATTAFVQAAVSAATTGVSSFNTRTGAVVLTGGDLTGAGGALLASPVFTGTPSGPTATLGTSSTQLATTAFVQAQLAAGIVSSFNTRTGAVTLTLADVTGVGGAPIASPALTGTPTAATATAGTSTTQLATTAFVANAVAAIGTGVTSFEGRTGAVTLLANDISAVGGALLAGPAFTGIPTAPTAAVGTDTTQLATTAFVMAATAAGGGVSSFNTRTGAVVLTAADVSAVNGALLASPIFTGIPLAPQATVGTVTNQIATCSFVQAQIATGITSFNTRTGAVTLTTADITGAGGAPIASPNFTGVPLAPTAAVATSTTQIASTAFVQAAIAAGAVASFNGRTGAVSLLANDISAAGGALLASPIFTGTPLSSTAVPGTNTTQIATTAFVAAALAAGGGVTSFNGRAGVVTLSAADITGAGGALLAGPTFTGIPAAPTPAQTVNTTQIATTAFVTTKVAGYLPLAGGTLTGQLNIAPASGGATLNLEQRTATGGNTIIGGTNNSNRWAMYLGNGEAEAGANAGSNFAITRYSDAAAVIDTPLRINRATGEMTFSQPVNITGSPQLTLNQSVAANSNPITGETGGVPRWNLFLGDGSAESGGNAGSNFIIQCLSDSGGFIQNAMTITRASGQASFPVTIVNGSSDRTLKKNIKPIQDALDTVMKLQGVSFDWIDSGDHKLGMIAQDVAPIVPEAIQRFDRDGERKLALDYPQFIGLLVEAVKTLAARVTSLENIGSRA